MTKHIDISKLKAVASSAAPSVDILVFRPDLAQRQAKSAFWSHFYEDKASLPEEIPLALAERYGADKRISTWWALPGFSEWFTNHDEFRQRLEYIANLSLDELEKVLTNREVPASVKVPAIKLSMELARKLPTRNGADTGDGGYHDEFIAKMDKKQLEEYIRTRNTRFTANEK